jgi:hypothetical protein
VTTAPAGWRAPPGRAYPSGKPTGEPPGARRSAVPPLPLLVPEIAVQRGYQKLADESGGSEGQRAFEQLEYGQVVRAVPAPTWVDFGWNIPGCWFYTRQRLGPFLDIRGQGPSCPSRCPPTIITCGLRRMAEIRRSTVTDDQTHRSTRILYEIIPGQLLDRRSWTVFVVAVSTDPGDAY